MSIKIALAGNPNSGKTTLFNALTGANQYVGNWPGVTVEKKEGKLKGNKDVIIQDLPGIYSLSPYTLEEVVSREYLVTQKPDAILNIVDGSNIERNLYLTTQLLELGIPMVIAVNMMDIVRKNGDTVDTKKLSKQLGVKVVEISALKNEGSMEAANAAVLAATNASLPALPAMYEESVAPALGEIKKIIAQKAGTFAEWYAVKVFERDEKAVAGLGLTESEKAACETIIRKAETELDDDAESIVTNQRYNFIGKVCAGAVRKKGVKHGMTVSDKIDRIVTNRWLGIPIFLGILFIVYLFAMWDTPISIGTKMTDFTNDVIFGEWVPGLIEKLLTALGVAEGSWLWGLILAGIVAGVGAVLGFVPQMLVLFLFLSIMEDCGYMARVAFVWDRLFRQFGLSGKSFIPIIVGTGCGVPGIMASRTIENDRDRKLTIMTTTFIPCGAKLPIIGLIVGAIFGGNGLIGVLAFVVGAASIVITGIILKKFKLFAGEPAPFVMELPAYHAPLVGGVLRSTWERGRSFIKRAGSVIVLSSIIIWFLSSFGTVNGRFGLLNEMWEDPEIVTEETIAHYAQKMNIPEEEVNSMDASILADVGNAVSVVFRPVGFGSWRPTVATVTGLVAKEEVINTFGILYNYDDSEEELGDEGEGVWANVRKDFPMAAALAFLFFNLLCAPCFAAMGAIKREMNNWKWTLGTIGFMCLWAYLVALMTYQFVGLATGIVAFGVGTVAAILAAAVILFLLFRKGYKPEGGAKSLTAVQAAGK